MIFLRDLQDEQVYNGFKNCQFYLSQNFLTLVYAVISKTNKDTINNDKHASLCKKTLDENKTWLNKSNYKKNFHNNNLTIKSILKNLVK